MEAEKVSKRERRLGRLSLQKTLDSSSVVFAANASFLVERKEVLAVALIIALHGILELVRRQPVSSCDLVAGVTEIEIAHDVVNICVTVNSAFTSGKD